MKLYPDKFYEFIARPIFPGARLILAALVIPLGLTFTEPLWRISMEAPQYRNGLSLDIYAYKIEGGREGRDLAEINTLNHYIGMKKLDRAAMSDLDWMPFALGGLAIFALRVAAIGNISALLDLIVLTLYVSLFAFGRFIYMMYTFGHNLSPEAAVKVPGFMPAIFGSKQVANFLTHSYPNLGSAYLGVYATGLLVLVAWHLVAGRRRAVAEMQRQAAASVTTS